MKLDGEKNVLDNSVTKSGRDDTSLPRLISSPELSSQTPEWSMVSVSPRTPTRLGHLLSPGVSAQDPDWNMLRASPRQSPPIQMMDEPIGYDPNRIPSSIFCRKPTSPMEWSVASNESLFSLHTGNNSFPRDHGILFGISEEVKLDKYSNNSPSTVIELAADNDGQSADTAEDSQVKEVGEETQKCVSKGTAEDHDKKKVPPDDRARTSASTSRHSTESGNRRGSFAFPILAVGGGTNAPVKVVPEKPSGEGGPSTSEKAVPEKPPSQQQTPGVTANTAGTKCFSCLSCCPLCC